MFRLLIKREDGTLYWKETFETQGELEAWLLVERSRPYWDATFTTEIIDRTPTPPTQEEIEAENQRRQQITNLKQRIKNLASQEDLTNAEVKEAIMKFLRIQVLSGHI